MVFSALVGVVSYVYFFWSLPLQASAFMINLGTLVPALAAYFPYGIDDNSRLYEDFQSRLAVNVALLGLFAIPHSIFARPAVKNWIGAPDLYRSLYCFKSAACLHLLIAYWQPVFETTLWSFSNPTVSLIGYGLGWFWLVTSTFAIDHFELFGIKQSLGVDLYGMIGLTPGAGMVERAHYGLCRHPIMLGFFIMFVSVPTMTLNHLFFSVACTLYILLAVQFLEEPDMVSEHGDSYNNYKARVPMYCPFTGGSKQESNKKGN